MMGLVCVALKFETSRAQERSLCFKAKSHMIYCLMLHCDQAAPPPLIHTKRSQRYCRHLVVFVFH